MLHLLYIPIAAGTVIVSAVASPLTGRGLVADCRFADWNAT
jgi:hypothetical protein